MRRLLLMLAMACAVLACGKGARISGSDAGASPATMQPAAPQKMGDIFQPPSGSVTISGPVSTTCDAGNCQVAVANIVTTVTPAVTILGTTLPIPASSLAGLNDGGAVHITKVSVNQEPNAPLATCCIFQLATCPTVFDAGANTNSVPGPVECFPVSAGWGSYSAVDDWGSAGLGLTAASVCCSTTGIGDGGAGAGGVFTAAGKYMDLTAFGYSQ